MASKSTFSASSDSSFVLILC